MQVAPLVGAWIEISGEAPLSDQPDTVAPLVGAWIEIPVSGRRLRTAGSLPSWERGLKLHPATGQAAQDESLPSWERGLKSAR